MTRTLAFNSILRWPMLALAVASASCLRTGEGDVTESETPVVIGSAVSFIIRDAESGRPIAGAAITLTPAGGSAPITAHANGSGEVTFISAPQGIATVTVTAQGHRVETASIVIPANTASDQPRFEVLVAPSS